MTDIGGCSTRECTELLQLPLVASSDTRDEQWQSITCIPPVNIDTPNIVTDDQWGRHSDVFPVVTRVPNATVSTSAWRGPSVANTRRTDQYLPCHSFEYTPAELAPVEGSNVSHCYVSAAGSCRCVGLYNKDTLSHQLVGRNVVSTEMKHPESGQNIPYDFGIRGCDVWDGNNCGNPFTQPTVHTSRAQMGGAALQHYTPDEASAVYPDESNIPLTQHIACESTQMPTRKNDELAAARKCVIAFASPSALGSIDERRTISGPVGSRHAIIERTVQRRSSYVPCPRRGVTHNDDSLLEIATGETRVDESVGDHTTSLEQNGSDRFPTYHPPPTIGDMPTAIVTSKPIERRSRVSELIQMFEPQIDGHKLRSKEALPGWLNKYRRYVNYPRGDNYEDKVTNYDIGDANAPVKQNHHNPCYTGVVCGYKSICTSRHIHNHAHNLQTTNNKDYCTTNKLLVPDPDNKDIFSAPQHVPEDTNCCCTLRETSSCAMDKGTISDHEPRHTPVGKDGITDVHPATHYHQFDAEAAVEMCQLHGRLSNYGCISEPVNHHQFDAEAAVELCQLHGRLSNYGCISEPVNHHQKHKVSSTRVDIPLQMCDGNVDKNVFSNPLTPTDDNSVGNHTEACTLCEKTRSTTNEVRHRRESHVEPQTKGRGKNNAGIWPCASESINRPLRKQYRHDDSRDAEIVAMLPNKCGVSEHHLISGQAELCSMRAKTDCPPCRIGDFTSQSAEQVHRYITKKSKSSSQSQGAFETQNIPNVVSPAYQIQRNVENFDNFRRDEDTTSQSKRKQENRRLTTDMGSNICEAQEQRAVQSETYGNTPKGRTKQDPLCGEGNQKPPSQSYADTWSRLMNEIKTYAGKREAENHSVALRSDSVTNSVCVSRSMKNARKNNDKHDIKSKPVRTEIHGSVSHTPNHPHSESCQDNSQQGDDRQNAVKSSFDIPVRLPSCQRIPSSTSHAKSQLVRVEHDDDDDDDDDIDVLSAAETKLRILQKYVKYIRRHSDGDAGPTGSKSDARDSSSSDGRKGHTSQRRNTSDTAERVSTSQRLGRRKNENVEAASWKRAHETIASIRHFVKHGYWNTSLSLMAECALRSHVHHDLQEETCREHILADASCLEKLPKTQTRYTKRCTKRCTQRKEDSNQTGDLMRCRPDVDDNLLQPTLSLSSNTSGDDDSSHTTYGLNDESKPTSPSINTTETMDQLNVSQNANFTPDGKEAKVPVFRSTWTPTIGEHRPNPVSYVPRPSGSGNVASSHCPGRCRENRCTCDEDCECVWRLAHQGGYNNRCTRGSDVSRLNEGANFVKKRDQSPSRTPPAVTQTQMEYNQSPPTQLQMGYAQSMPRETTSQIGYIQSPTPMTSAQMEYIHSPPVMIPGHMGYIQSPPTVTSAQMGYIQSPPTMIPGQMEYIQSPPTMIPGQMEYIQSPPTVTSAQMGYIQSPPTMTPGQIGYTQYPPTITPSQMGHIQSPYRLSHAPTGYMGHPSAFAQLPRNATFAPESGQKIQSSTGFISPPPAAPRPFLSRRRSTGSLSDSDPGEMRRSPTARIISDTLKGSEYSVMYMCDPKCPDIIRKLAIIPNHCLHDHRVCVSRIEKAERQQKRRSASVDGADDGVQSPPLRKRYNGRGTMRMSLKRKDGSMPKMITLTDKYGFRRRLRLKQRRRDARDRPLRMQGRRINPDYRENGHQRWVNSGGPAHPRRVLTGEHVRPRPVLSHEDISPRRFISGGPDRPRRVLSGGPDRPRRVLSDENVVATRRMLHQRELNDNKPIEDDSSTATPTSTTTSSSTDPDDLKERKKQKRKKKKRKKRKQLISRLLFPTPGSMRDDRYRSSDGETSQSERYWSIAHRGVVVPAIWRAKARQKIATRRPSSWPATGDRLCAPTPTDVSDQAGRARPRHKTVRRDRLRRRIDAAGTGLTGRHRLKAIPEQSVSAPPPRHLRPTNQKPPGPPARLSDRRPTAVPLHRPSDRRPPTMPNHRTSDRRPSTMPNHRPSDRRPPTMPNHRTSDRRPPTMPNHRPSDRRPSIVPDRRSDRRSFYRPPSDSRPSTVPNRRPSSSSPVAGRRPTEFLQFPTDTSVRQLEPFTQGRPGGVDDVNKKRKHRKHNDKQSKKNRQKHFGFVTPDEESDMNNGRPMGNEVIPTLRINSPEGSLVVFDSNSPNTRKHPKRKTKKKDLADARRKSTARMQDDRLNLHGDDADSLNQNEENAVQFWTEQVKRKSLEADAHRRSRIDRKSVNLGDRTTQQRSNNNAESAYMYTGQPYVDVDTRYDDQSQSLCDDQCVCRSSGDVCSMGQERFHAIREAFETGILVSLV